MKKTILKVIMVATALAMPTASQAQISSKLKSLTSGLTSSSSSSSSTASSVVSSLVSNLLGANTLKESNLVGTWNYTGPCVVLESDNVLSNIGGTVVTSKIESEEEKILEKFGFTAGDVVLTLKSGGSGTLTVGEKSTSLTWEVSDSTLTFTVVKKSVDVNASLSSGTLQLAMSADKLLSLMSAITNAASSVTSSASTLTTLLSKYDGLYLGLEFSK